MYICIYSRPRSVQEQKCICGGCLQLGYHLGGFHDKEMRILIYWGQ